MPFQATGEPDRRVRLGRSAGVRRSRCGRSRDPVSGGCRPAHMRAHRSGNRRRPGAGRYLSARNAPSRDGRRGLPSPAGARRTGFRAHEGIPRSSRRPGTMLSPRPIRPSTRREPPRDRPRGVPLVMGRQSERLRPTRRAGRTCRRQFSRVSATPATRSDLRTWTSHGVEQGVDGLSESQAPVDAIDRVGRTASLPKDCVTVAQDELDLGSCLEPQLIAHLNRHRDLALGRDPTPHE
jgi:hypothetical protein